jgi:uncharacterized membrane protein YhhN
MSPSARIVLLYFLIALIEITGDFTNNLILVYAFKPLLMPILIIWVLQVTSKSTTYRGLMIASLIGSFIGDTFLMFLPYNENLFLVGLGSFLIAQIIYAIIFFKQIKASKTKGDNRLYALWLIVFVAFYYMLMNYLWPNLGEFLIPVLVYGSTICVMGLLAAYRYNKVNTTSYLLVLIGAVTFIFSDTLIAINQFIYKGNMPFAQVIIMVLYVLAQYLIVKGWVLSTDKQAHKLTKVN